MRPHRNTPDHWCSGHVNAKTPGLRGLSNLWWHLDSVLVLSSSQMPKRTHALDRIINQNSRPQAKMSLVLLPFLSLPDPLSVSALSLSTFSKLCLTSYWLAFDFHPGEAKDPLEWSCRTPSGSSDVTSLHHSDGDKNNDNDHNIH